MILIAWSLIQLNFLQKSKKNLRKIYPWRRKSKTWSKQELLRKWTKKLRLKKKNRIHLAQLLLRNSWIKKDRSLVSKVWTMLRKPKLKLLKCCMRTTNKSFIKKWVIKLTKKSMKNNQNDRKISSKYDRCKIFVRNI